MLTVTDPGRRVVAASTERKPYARIPEVLPIPNLIELQRNSFNWFLENGLRELLDEITPIQDFTGRGWSSASASTSSRRRSTPSSSAAARPDLRRAALRVASNC